MEHLPLGCIFKPNSKQIHKYLRKRVHDIQEPKVNLNLIPELDVYQVCPADLQGLSRKGYTYFFTRRSTKKDSVSRNARQTKDGKGYWCASTRKKSKGTPELIKRTLVYHLKAANVKGRGQKTNWIMHEYELQSADEKAKVNEKIVMCGVYERNKQNEDTETETDEDEIKSTQDSQQKNTAAETNEESSCVNLIKEIDQSHQGHDQHKNTTSTSEKEMELTLQLWPGEQK